MKIYFAGDHAGFELKGKLIKFVQSLGYEVEDLGPFSYDTNDDYPDYVVPLAKKVADTLTTPPRGLGTPPQAGGEVRGVIIGGSGQGEAMCANRIRDARAAVYYGGDVVLVVGAAREHNNANILSLGARFVGEAEAQKAVRAFLETPFSGHERHIRRLAKIDLLAA